MYYLGSITGASGAYSNQQTGASGIGTFTIPKYAKSLYLYPSASGVSFEFGTSTGFQTTLARAMPLSAHVTPTGSFEGLNGPFRVIDGEATTVSIYYTGAGFVSVRVYSAPTS